MNRLRASRYKNEGEHKKEIFSWQLLLISTTSDLISTWFTWHFFTCQICIVVGGVWGGHVGKQPSVRPA